MSFAELKTKIQKIDTQMKKLQSDMIGAESADLAKLIEKRLKLRKQRERLMKRI